MSIEKEIDLIEKKNKRIALILTVVFAALILLNFLIISLVYGWADWIAILLFSLLLIVPAYLSNAGMVIMGGGKPIDGGKKLRDGRRIFGSHKTWSGLIKGPLFIGIPISLGMYLIFIILWPIIASIPQTGITQGQYHLYTSVYVYQYYFIGGNYPLGFLSLVIRVFLCSYGAAVGDLIGSFVKRRFNISSGSPFWIVDQLDFAIFALIFISIPGLILPSLFLIPDLNIIIFLLILTPSVSVIANTVAYLASLKNVPW